MQDKGKDKIEIRAKSSSASPFMRAKWNAIFDWDGVVIDSSAQHERSWHELAREEKRTLPDGFFKRSFGMKNEFIIPNMLGWATDPQEIQRISSRKEVLYRELLDGISPLPGVIGWLERLMAAGVPCAIGSSTPRMNIDCAMKRIRLQQFFMRIVSSEDVTHGKPDPEVFLKSAQALGVEPSKCVVFEDAHVGVEAARAAGMRVVAVTTTHPAESFKNVDRIVQRLDELSVKELARWF